LYESYINGNEKDLHKILTQASELAFNALLITPSQWLVEIEL